MMKPIDQVLYEHREDALEALAEAFVNGPDNGSAEVLARLLTDVRRAAGEQIAQAIEAHAARHLPTWLRSNYEDAARIAREMRP